MSITQGLECLKYELLMSVVWVDGLADLAFKIDIYILCDSLGIAYIAEPTFISFFISISVA